MFGGILILLPLSIFSTLSIRSNRYRPVFHLLFWIFVFNFLFLLWLGAKPISQPYINLGLLSTFIYFLYFLILFIMG